MKIGILCPSEIALRRFMPAISSVDEFEYVGLGVCTKEERFPENVPDEETVNEVLNAEMEKAKAFIDQYGGKVFNGYQGIIESDEIEAVYIPLPPALHYKWALKSLEAGKHVLVEKPSTISAEQTKKLIEVAEDKGLALHENYMFNFHEQLNAIEDIIKSREIGDIRLYRVSFGFPQRAANDFRYNKALGGGALIDAGGYTIKYATRLLGETAELKYAQMNYKEGFEVDIYGSGAMVNAEGTTVQLAFGMDNNYKCELEAWGSKGCLTTGRVLTAPTGFVPSVTIRKGNEDEVRSLPADDAFRKSIMRFWECIGNDNTRRNNYKELIRQAELVDEFRNMANLQ
ncbi:MAG: Gfo/Idh/MocA family oxidoreductase [Butyrivibrio sp.]|nr:Gfo/Idh/MocA family oxidoreductase [Butyrivibrio sp.]